MATTITPTIVNLNVTQKYASKPSQLQRSGAVTSFGGTSLPVGTYTYCGQLSDATSIVSSGTEATFVTNSATTFFAQGSSVGCYVLELGTQSTVAAEITALQTWITANADPQVFYAYLLPASWDASSGALNTMASNYSSPNGRTYFFVTTTSSTVSAYSGNKAVIATVPAPTAATTEQDSAALFYEWLVNNPSPTALAAPLAYRFVYGVTPWVRTGNSTAINTVLTAYGNVILTGSEGGLSTSSIFKGQTMDGTQAMSWYGVDWIAIQIKQALAAAIINGSNSNNPLIYNQTGINALLTVAQGVCNTAVKYNLAESAVVTATPFATYTADNPNDYAAGLYAGFTCTVVDISGFLTITFDIDSTQLVS